MLLSIIIPYYNEPTLLEVVESVYLVDFSDICSIEVIVIDDGSTDNSKELLENQKKRFPEIILVKHSINKGKGAAIKTGLSNCRGDVIIIQDADLEYNPKDIPSIIKPIISGKTKACYGSRHLGKPQKTRNFLWFKSHVGQTILPYLGGRLITILCNLLFNSQLSDVLTCYKAFDKQLITNINLSNNGFELEAEITAKVLKMTNISEVPISYSPRLKSEGKKIKLLDGFKIIVTYIKYKFIK